VRTSGLSYWVVRRILKGLNFILMSDQSDEKERLIRGRVLQISATIEMVLARIILFSNLSNPKDEQVIFKSMMMSGKIKKASEMIKQYYPSIYSENKEVFEELNSAKDFRNRITHCSFNWDDPMLMSFQVWDLEIGEDGIQYYSPIRYTIDQIFSEIERLKRVTISILKITIAIEDGLQNKYPDFLNAVGQGRHL
jgi:hypothetical protein